MRRIAISSVTVHILLCCSAAILTACVMYLPTARDDLSVLGNDVFSQLIRSAYSEKVLVPDAGGHLGPSQIDRMKAREIARNTMRGKTAKEVIETFNHADGQCVPTPQKKMLTCDVVRRWKLKNIGAPFDTKFWSDPAAKLLYRIVLSESDLVVDLDLEIIDITEYKPIISRPVN